MEAVVPVIVMIISRLLFAYLFLDVVKVLREPGPWKVYGRPSLAIASHQAIFNSVGLVNICFHFGDGDTWAVEVWDVKLD